MPDQIIQNPTYLEHIRHFFDEVDLAHMFKLGIDLSTHATLSARSVDVYFQTRPPDAFMPPEADRKWSPERSETFQNWIKNGHPFGRPAAAPPQPSEATRIRKDARDLSAEETDTLGRAFQGMMDRAPEDPESYFALAGLHWFPRPTFCKHHEDRYNPWHRVYVTRFEDALRTVPGCADVTLPYWEVTAAPPDFLSAPPFAAYTLPREIHPAYPAGYTTQRFDPPTIAANLAEDGIAGVIDHAMRQPVWNDFIAYTGQGIEAAHDLAHPSCGPTMTTPDAAAFDPLFWLFHTNWDRLWWKWQQTVQATTYWTLRSTITGSTAFLEPPFHALEPFPATADQTIDLSRMDVGYAEPAGAGAAEPVPVPELASFGSLSATRPLRVHRAPVASARLKGVDRLAIPGTFRAVLKADGQPVARRAFFQSTEPRGCDNCRKNALVDLDFLVDPERITGAELTVDVELLTREDPRVGERVSLAACGGPTVNLRMLLQEAM
jgi:hypothetical protein